MRVQAEVEMNPRMLAEAFCELGDEAQAQFFIECAAIAETWTDSRGNKTWPSSQWYSVGRHLRTCTCSTSEAREMVDAIATGAGYCEV
jgi:hypothetical protein